MLDEDGLREYIKGIKDNVEIDESVLTLSMLIDMLSYSTVDYRLLIIDKKNEIRNINSKIINESLLDIVFSTQDGFSITFVFESGTIKVFKKTIDGKVEHEKNGNLKSINDSMFISDNFDYINNSLEVMSNTVSKFSDNKSTVVDVANLYQNILCGDISVAVSPIYKPLIFYKGIDVTDERLIRESMDSLYQSVVIDKSELINEFSYLYSTMVEPIYK